MPGWEIIGVPVDCSGRGRGEADAPAALRAASLAQALDAEDRGDVEARVDDAERDPDTGVIGYRQILRANRGTRDAVRRVRAAGGRPIVVGGDCSMLPGALAGAGVGDAPQGLAFVDGHLDSHDGSTSPEGEAADMPLAVALGRGGPDWVAVGGAAPVLEAEHVIVLGHREGPDELDEVALLPEGVERWPAGPLAEYDPAAVGEACARRLAALPGGFWLHLDTDVLDAAEMPASTYTGPGGLSWSQLEHLLPPLLRADSLAGVSLADYRPDLDPDGGHARRLVALLAAP